MTLASLEASQCYARAVHVGAAFPIKDEVELVEGRAQGVVSVSL